MTKLKQSGFCCVLTIAFAQLLVAQDDAITVSVLKRDGSIVTGTTDNQVVRFSGNDRLHTCSLKNILSYQSADPASEHESKTIKENLELLGNKVEPAAEIAAAKLADIGLPVMNSLLKGYQDTTAQEPDYRYRLFGRIVPGHADCVDRSLGLLRKSDGTTVRTNLEELQLKLTTNDGKIELIKSGNIRRLATLRDKITRTFELQALHHCTYVGFLDSGIISTPTTGLVADAKGFVRLSFDEDGWASDPHGIVTPLPGKRKLQEGFRWGSVLARVGPTGDRWFVGKHIEKTGLGNGRLYFVINDNEHWQNNIGSFRVKVTVQNAFDVGEPF